MASQTRGVGGRLGGGRDAERGGAQKAAGVPPRHTTPQPSLQGPDSHGCPSSTPTHDFFTLLLLVRPGFFRELRLNSIS